MSNHPQNDLSPEEAKRAGRYLCYVISERNRPSFFIAADAAQANAFRAGLAAYDSGLDEHPEIALTIGYWPDASDLEEDTEEDRLLVVTKLLSLGWITEAQAEAIAQCALHEYVGS